ncbi:hypothetical protein ACFLT1_00495 [Bacteroidota bacterium]
MKLHAILFFIGILTISPVLHGQGKKTIKEQKLERKTVQEYFIAEGQKEPVVELIEVFDKNGNTIELKEYNSEGELKNWYVYVYDENDNKIEEKLFDQKGKVLERTVWIYKDDLVVEKLYYDHKDRLVKRKEYKYEYYSE